MSAETRKINVRTVFFLILEGIGMSSKKNYTKRINISIEYKLFANEKNYSKIYHYTLLKL